MILVQALSVCIWPPFAAVHIYIYVWLLGLSEHRAAHSNNVYAIRILKHRAVNSSDDYVPGDIDSRQSDGQQM